MENNTKPSPVDYEHVTLILREASAYGLEWEVKEAAAKYVKKGYGYVESFQMAYQDWVKQMNEQKFHKKEKELLKKITILESDPSDKNRKKTNALRKKLIKHRLENQQFWKDSSFWF